MGKIFKFHTDVDTDQIIASQYLLFPTIDEMKTRVFDTFLASCKFFFLYLCGFLPLFLSNLNFMLVRCSALWYYIP